MKLRGCIALIEALYANAKKVAPLAIGVATVTGTIAAFLNGGKKAERAVQILAKEAKIADENTKKILKKLELNFDEMKKNQDKEIALRKELEKRSEQQTIELITAYLKLIEISTDEKVRHTTYQRIKTIVDENDSSHIIDIENYPCVAQYKKPDVKYSLSKLDCDSFLTYFSDQYDHPEITNLVKPALKEVTDYYKKLQREIPESATNSSTPPEFDNPGSNDSGLPE